jgi:hypothetical protein
MGQIRKSRCGYEYVSNNGIVYEIGENGADFNIIIDTFSDCDEKYEELAPYNSHLVDFVFGDINDEDVLDWIDERIARYENHERVVQFYDGQFCECYIGLKTEKHLPVKRVPKEALFVEKK